MELNIKLEASELEALLKEFQAKRELDTSIKSTMLDKISDIAIIVGKSILEFELSSTRKAPSMTSDYPDLFIWTCPSCALKTWALRSAYTLSCPNCHSVHARIGHETEEVTEKK